MRKNFEAKAYLYPMLDENGKPDAMNATWGWNK